MEGFVQNHGWNRPGVQIPRYEDPPLKNTEKGGASFVSLVMWDHHFRLLTDSALVQFTATVCPTFKFLLLIPLGPRCDFS